MGTRPLPKPAEGTWLDITSGDDEQDARLRELLEPEVDPRELTGGVLGWMRYEHFTWSAFERWREEFIARGECPAMWIDTLFEDIPPNLLSPEQVQRMRGLSSEARRLMATGEAPLSDEERQDRAELSAREFLRAEEELAVGGVVFRSPSVSEALGVLRIQELRVIQKESGLKGARSKEALRAIIVEGCSEEELLQRLPAGIRLLDGVPAEDPGWYEYCYQLSRLLVHSAQSEKHFSERHADAVRAGASKAAFSAAGDGLDSVCEKLDGRSIEVSESEPWLPHFPGCRCATHILAYGARPREVEKSPHVRAPVKSSTGSRTQARRKKTSVGCLGALLGMLAVAAWRIALQVAP